MRIEDLKEALMRGFAERRRDEMMRGLRPHREDITCRLRHAGEAFSLRTTVRAGLALAPVGILVCACWRDDSLGAPADSDSYDVWLDSHAPCHRLGAMVADAEQVLITCVVLS